MLTWPFRNHPIGQRKGRVYLRTSLVAGLLAIVAGLIPSIAFGALIGTTADALSRITAGVFSGLIGVQIIAVPALIGAHLMHVIVRRIGAINHLLTTLTGFLLGYMLMAAIDGEWSPPLATFAGISGALAAFSASIYLHLALAPTTNSQED